MVLGGKVSSYTEKYVAEALVKNIRGVHAVANELEVDLSIAYKQTDAEIAKKAVNALRLSVFVPDENIKGNGKKRPLNPIRRSRVLLSKRTRLKSRPRYCRNSQLN